MLVRALSLAALLCVQAAAEEPIVSIPVSFINGAEYLKMSPDMKRGYAMGIVDGLHASPLMGAPEDSARRLHRCLVKMQDEQIAEILSKYLRDHPEVWHQDMHALTIRAFHGICGDF